jgi:hypothetical protein
MEDYTTTSGDNNSYYFFRSYSVYMNSLILTITWPDKVCYSHFAGRENEV